VRTTLDSNARSGPNASANASENPAKQAGSGNTDNTGIRVGEFSEDLSAFLANSPDWYTRQAAECKLQGAPQRLLKPMATAVAHEVFADTHRWSEVLPRVEASLNEAGTV
jgi:hypothetical protein